jgi:hypothetical protein
MLLRCDFRPILTGTILPQNDIELFCEPRGTILRSEILISDLKIVQVIASIEYIFRANFFATVHKFWKKIWWSTPWIHACSFKGRSNRSTRLAQCRKRCVPWWRVLNARCSCHGGWLASQCKYLTSSTEIAQRRLVFTKAHNMINYQRYMRFYRKTS